MKRVCFFDLAPQEDFHGYRIETFDPMSYFGSAAHGSLNDLIAGGLNGYDKRRAIFAGAPGVDRLYRERDPAYMRMVGDFIDRFRDFDLIVVLHYNFIHPEIWRREFKRPVKVLGFTDDPYSTYARGLPYLWAFDGAFFISPSYIDDMRFEDAFARWGKPAIWWPLVTTPTTRPQLADEAFFRKRDVDLVYVGNPHPLKVDRLARLKRHFGARVRIHGRWRFGGWVGFLRVLTGKPIYPYRVTSLTAAERTSLYWRSKIAFNMHVSEPRSETGNMRMYEAPAHGMMMVCDKGGADGHARIFRPDEEAVYYDSLDDAIERIDYYLRHDDERVSIARRGFARYWADYEWEGNLLRLLRWAESLRRDEPCAEP
ncbi:MAG TPA: glycosyltransferase [Burkholderiaceae bacterium]